MTDQRLLGRAFKTAAALAVVAGLAVPHAEASFPGHNGRILFEVNQFPARNYPFVAHDFDLFSISPGGSGLQQLTDGPESDFWASWSPDGSRIAFTRAANYQAPGDIWVMNADGSDPINLTNSPQYDDRQPSWSPDGERLVIHRSSVSTWVPLSDLFVMDADGSNVTRVTSDPFKEWFPTWSPDGEWIVFRTNDDGLDLITPNGQRRHELVTPDGLRGHSPFFPDWSPDGNRLAFVAGMELFSGSGANLNVWMVNADGTGLHEVTSDGNYLGVGWSPDGRKLAVSMWVGQQVRLGVMNPEGPPPRQLLDLDLSAPAVPDWGPRPT